MLRSFDFPFQVCLVDGVKQDKRRPQALNRIAVLRISAISRKFSYRSKGRPRQNLDPAKLRVGQAGGSIPAAAAAGWLHLMNLG